MVARQTPECHLTGDVFNLNITRIFLYTVLSNISLRIIIIYRIYIELRIRDVAQLFANDIANLVCD